MLGVFAVMAALVLLGAAFAGAGRFGELPEPVVDEYLPELPDRPLVPDDLRTARFAVRPRGYSRTQVDRLLARAAAQWDADWAPAASWPAPAETPTSVWADWPRGG
nr:DivIVA domain-containing protein [Propionibacterium sp.]